MYRSVLCTLSLIAVITATSCREPVINGSGAVKTEQRAVSSSFDHIAIEAPVDADIRVMAGSTPSVQLDGFSNILPYIELEVREGTLHIKVKQDAHLLMDKNIKAIITMPVLAGIDLEGSGDVVVKGNVTGDKLELEVAGSGTIRIGEVSVRELDAAVAGSGTLFIDAGTVQKASYNIAGSGEAHLFDMNSAESDVDIAGSGTIEITAANKLDISIAGSGDVRYKGNPVVTQDVAGSGSVVKIN